jgi:ribonuclease HI
MWWHGGELFATKEEQHNKDLLRVLAKLQEGILVQFKKVTSPHDPEEHKKCHFVANKEMRAFAKRMGTLKK